MVRRCPGTTWSVLLACLAGVALAPTAASADVPIRLDSHAFSGDIIAEASLPSRTDQTAPSPHRKPPAFALPRDRLAALPAVTLRPASPEAEQPPANVRQLPPLPNSVSMFLAAMAALGGIRVGQKARHWQFGHLPSWYHTDSPAQIAHVGVFDLQFAPAPACISDQPAGEHSPTWFHILRDLSPRPSRQYFLSVEAPRAPPRLHS